MTTLKTLLSITGLALLAAAQAAPAPWYYWRSKVDGHRICAQTSPGPGWTQDSGPYAGANCLPRRVLAQPAK